MHSTFDLSSIVAEKIGKKNYFREEFPKRQIYLNHSISHPHPRFMVDRWVNSPYKIASCFLIAGKPYPNEEHYEDGQVHQCFHSKFWALHLGVHAKTNKVAEVFKRKEHTRTLEKHSISVMLCNAGALSWENGRFYAPFRKVIPEEQVIEYPDPFRGNRFYHRYTDAQIASLGQLLLYLGEQYDIPLQYHSEIWEVSAPALQGAPGLYTRCSVRTDVNGCHPQPELIEMLANLTENTL